MKTASRPFTTAELQALLHPTEESRFDLALFVTFPVISIGLLVIFSTIPFVLGYLTLLAFVIWVGMQIARASLTANAVKVSPVSFPERYMPYTKMSAVFSATINLSTYTLSGRARSTHS